MVHLSPHREILAADHPNMRQTPACPEGASTFVVVDVNDGILYLSSVSVLAHRSHDISD